jgi:U3 small nucleolar ribonucleoprotein protein IMP4
MICSRGAPSPLDAPGSLQDPMILVTTSRKADPLVRRIGRDIAFAAGGRYLTRGKVGLSRPPFSDGTVLVLCRDGGGIRMQILDGMEEGASLRFLSVREEPRAGPLRRGLFTGNSDLFSSFSPHLPVFRDEALPESLALDGVQGRRIFLGV